MSDYLYQYQKYKQKYIQAKYGGAKKGTYSYLDDLNSPSVDLDADSDGFNSEDEYYAQQERVAALLKQKQDLVAPQAINNGNELSDLVDTWNTEQQNHIRNIYGDIENWNITNVDQENPAISKYFSQLQLQLTGEEVPEVYVHESTPISIPPNIVFRAIRPNELYNIFHKGALLPPCYPCPEWCYHIAQGMTSPPGIAGDLNVDPCCLKTPRQHVTSGSTADMKSAWISTTKSLHIASLWAARPKNGGDVFVSREEGNAQTRQSGIVIAINTEGLPPPLDPVTIQGEGKLGATALGMAKASEELLFYGAIPRKNIVQYYNARQTTKSDLQHIQLGEIAVTGKKKRASSKTFVKVVPLTEEQVASLIT